MQNSNVHVISNNVDNNINHDGRTKCEIWTRVMGYHRPVSSWNKGKQSEYLSRRCFIEPKIHSV